MKKQILLFCALMTMMASGLSAAVENGDCRRWYLSGIAGVNYVDSETEVGPELGFALGYRMSSNVRLEGEIVVRINEIKWIDAYFGTSTLSANILYDLDLRSPVKPYFGFGIGSQYREISFEGFDYTYRLEDNALAYQGIVGANIPLSMRAVVSLEYRYVANNAGSDVSQSLGCTLKRHF